MVMFSRRKKAEPKYCASKICGKLLVQKPNETPSLFEKRITCDKECANDLKTQRAEESGTSRCFCGAKKDATADFCCWDHRLVSIKCKNWKIPVSIKSYTAHCKLLEAKQREIEKATR